MRLKNLLTAAVLLGSTAAIAQGGEVARNPTVITGRLIATVKLSERIAGWRDVPARNERGIIGREDGLDNGEYEPRVIYPQFANQRDGAQQTFRPEPGAPVPQVNAGFNGIGYTSVCPADPSLAVGPNHVIQMINGGSGAYFRIWDKAGNALTAQTYMDAITGKGGLGDPIVMYDQLSDRFVMTEFANKSETGTEGLVIAVCQSNNPVAGVWKVYYYSSTLFPDYPKFSVWTDAWYCKTNDFKQQRYNGATLWAFDKNAMVAGAATATVQKFALGTSNKYYTACPVGLSGATAPPAGTGGLLAYINDGSWSGSSADSVGILQCKINFSNAALSTVSVAKSLAVSAYSLGSGSAPQCSNGQGLDVLRNRVMSQPQYRVINGAASIVLTHVADLTISSKATACPRWYELTYSATSALSTLSVKQQGTYNPGNDPNFRYMPSININGAGDIGLMYNVSGSSVCPSIRFTGRKSTDALGQMTLAETVIKAGSAASNCYNRYGDYNANVVDPADDITFWGTAMFNSAAAWTTFVSSFNLTGATGPLPATYSSGAPALDANPLQGSTVFPNPATNSITVTVPDAANNTNMQLLDFSGKAVLNRSVQAGANRVAIRSFAPGVYMVKLSYNGSSTVLKFVKE